MTNKHFIALAEFLSSHNKTCETFSGEFSPCHLGKLADFCQSQNPQFNRERWLFYIAGKCGKNGGKVK